MDLVYSVRAGKRRVLIYVLAEHQSKVDPWMAFRLLCYLVAIWKGYRAQHPRARKLPAILPIVVHHSPTGWTAPVAFEDLLDADAELLDALGPLCAPLPVPAGRPVGADRRGCCGRERR